MISRSWKKATILSGAVCIALSGMALAQEGEFYPKPKIRVSVTPKSSVIEGVSEIERQKFADEINRITDKKAGETSFAALAVGAENTVFLLSATSDGALDTKYRAKAAIARMTASARVAPILAETGLQDFFDIHDFLVLLGFEKLVISDGDSFSYEVTLSNSDGG